MDKKKKILITSSIGANAAISQLLKDEGYNTIAVRVEEEIEFDVPTRRMSAEMSRQKIRRELENMGDRPATFVRRERGKKIWD